MNQAILSYLMDAYKPYTVLVYGSFADGTNGDHSDFDALVVTDRADAPHDSAVIDGTPLDVHLFAPQAVRGDIDLSAFVQLYGAVAVLDTDGMGETLIARVRQYIDDRPLQSAAEKRKSAAWCVKMLSRAENADMQGDYRRHWLLIDSLEIYFDLRDIPYFGPKKAMLSLQKTDPAGCALYAKALKTGDMPSLQAWISHVIQNIPVNAEEP